jgi:hypothetical protein
MGRPNLGPSFCRACSTQIGFTYFGSVFGRESFASVGITELGLMLG